MESAAESLVTNSWQLLSEEYRQLSGVDGEVAELRDDVATMNALLRMQSEADDGAVDHFVREWMKQLRELRYDAEDCVDLYKLRIKTRSRGSVRLWFKHHFETLLSRRRLAGEISALRARAVAISERHARYGFNRDALRRSPSLSASAVLASSAHVLGRAGDPERHKVFGFDKQIHDLVELLKGETTSDLRVLSIVGFGGLGKTTLALELCRRLEAYYQRQAMVSVSQAFEPSRDLKQLLKRVVVQVVKAKIDNEKEIEDAAALDEINKFDDNNPAEKLGKLLQGKRYLIVIDDVWTIRAWEAILSELPDNKCHSAIIVTTRIENVAKACSPSIAGHHIHPMKKLDEESSKSLFVSRTFDNKGCPKQLENVMDNILKRCAGLPLAIVSIANVLAAYTSPGSIEKWRSVYRSIGSHMESHPTLEGMRQIVTLSYNHLPHELKNCMMYLSIFPEDYEIEKYRLLCRWIAEGLVMEKRGFTPMEVAESYLEELVSRNMIQIQVGFGYYWTLETCRVHDVLLEVMVSKSLECNFVSLIGGQYAGMSYDRIRRLSVQGDDSRRQSSVERAKKNMAGRRRQDNGFEGMNVQHVRSLSIFHQEWQQLLDRLDKFTLMRVLDLEGCVGLTKDHLQCICRLYLLRFLSFKGTDIKEVPPQIEKLEHLQTLDVRDTSSGCRLPETVQKLYQLERLQTSYNNEANFMWRLPQGLKKMTKLREVGFSVLANDIEVAKEVAELEHLQELVVYVDTKIHYEEVVLQQFTQSLSKSYSLRRLIIGDVVYHGKELNFLHTMPTPPRLLRYLMIAGGIDRLPSWIGEVTYLDQFNISWAKLVGDQLFDGLCNCPSLKTIIIHTQGYNGPELVARTTRHKFPALANLRVTSGYRYPYLIRFEEGSMENLQTLLVNMTDNEDKRIEGIEHLANIKEVELWGTKDNTAIDRALVELRKESLRRDANQQKFQIVVKYD